MAGSDIITRIKDCYPSQSKKRKQISDYILANVSACCFYSLKKLAATINISEVTLISYCRSLGFSSFTDFREALRKYTVFWNQPNERWQFESYEEEKAAERIVETEKASLSYIIESDQKEAIAKAAEMILSSERIFVAAHGVSQVSADYCTRRLISIGMNTIMLDLSDHHLLSSQLAQISADKSLLIAIAITPHGESTVKTVSLCKEEGIPVIAITDNPESRIASEATCSLSAPASILGVTNSILPSISIIEILSILASIKAKSKSAESGKRYRKMLELISH